MIITGKRKPLLSRLKSGSALVDATTKAWYLYAPPTPTVVQYYINTGSTSGGDGTTNATTGAGRAFVNWSDARTAILAAYPNLVAANVQITIDVTGTVSSGSSFDCTLLNGDATRFVKVRAATGQSHSGYYTAGKAGFSNNSALTMNNLSAYMQFENLQILTTNSVGNGFISTSDSYGIVVSNCVLHSLATSSSSGAAYLGANGRISITFVNNVISGPWFNGFSQQSIFAGSQVIAYNNTIIGCTATGIVVSSSNHTFATTFLKNNRVEGGTACYSLGSNVVTTATNFSSDATSPDGASYQSKTGTYVNAAAFNYTLTSSDVGIGAATPTVYDVTYLLSTDIIGTARPQQTTWDIGAFEYVLTGGTTYFSTLAASLTATATASPRTLHPLAASLASTAVFLRSALHPLAASLTSTATIARSAAKNIPASLTTIGTVSRAMFSAMSASATLTATVSTLKVALRSLAAALTGT